MGRSLAHCLRLRVPQTGWLLLLIAAAITNSVSATEFLELRNFSTSAESGARELPGRFPSSLPVPSLNSASISSKAISAGSEFYDGQSTGRNSSDGAATPPPSKPVVEDAAFLLDEKIRLEKGIYQVFRFIPKKLDELSFLNSLVENSTQYDLDFWKLPRGPGALVDVMVPPSYQKELKTLLWNEGIEYDIIIEDVEQKIFQHEKRSRQSEFGKRKLRDDVGRSYYNFRQYQSYETMRRYMRSVEFAFPNIARVYTIGRTHQGRPIEVMKIGNPVGDDSRKVIWLDGGIHAREWAAPHVATYFIYMLTTKYGRDPRITNYVNSLTFFVAPNLNPDGYEYSRTAAHPVVRLWRKNRAPSVCPHSQLCCSGVDLNRNFDIEWGKVGTSHHPCSGIYGGTSPFSEPESRAVRDVIWGRKHQIEAFVTLHTYAQMWTHGYGYVTGQYPFDVQDLQRVGYKAAENIAKLFGTRYQVGSAADLLYPSAGGSDDWAKEKAGIKWTYLIEMRPDVNEKDGFILPERQLLPTAQETWAGLTAVIDEVITRNARPTLTPQICSDEPNPLAIKWTCGQQKLWGWCTTAFMRGFCRRSCGQCVGGGLVQQCSDNVPQGPYTCQQYRQWNLCAQPFMRGYCDLTCGKCNPIAGGFGVGTQRFRPTQFVSLNGPFTGTSKTKGKKKTTS